VVLAVDRLSAVAGLVEREDGAAFEAEDADLVAAAFFGDPARGGGHGGAVNHGPRRIVHSGGRGNRADGWGGEVGWWIGSRLSGRAALGSPGAVREAPVRRPARVGCRMDAQRAPG